MPSSAGTRRLRVVISAPGHMLGGQARAAADIVAGFRDDPELQVTLQPIDPRLPGRWRALTDWRVVRSVVRPLLYVRRLRRALDQADVLHVFCAAHTAFFFGAVPAVWLARRKGVPVVLNYHDGRAEAHFRLWGPVIRWAIRNATLLAFPSPYLQRIFRARGHEGVVVPNVVDTSAFTWHRPSTPMRPRMVSSRLLETLYAVDNTVRAFALVRAELPDATLDVFGAGHAAESLRRLATELRLEGIRFHGAVPHDRMPAAYGDGGVLVNSSRIDNAPHVIIEALAAGLPIVTTPAGGIVDMVEHERTALFVAFDDPRSMADAVLRLLRDPALAHRLATTGRDACQRYSWTEAARGWRAVYGRVAAASHPRTQLVSSSMTVRNA